jgi:hypothetical protein
LNRLLQGESIPLISRSLEDHNRYRFSSLATEEISRLPREKVIPSLITRLNDSNNYYLRYGVVELLGKLKAKEAIPYLIPLIRDHYATPFGNDEFKLVICGIASEVLGQLQAKEAIPYLIPLLKHSNGDLTRSAGEALSRIYIKYHQKFNVINLPSIDESRQILIRELMITFSTSFLSVICLLIMLLKFESLIIVNPPIHIIYCFPEEVVSELAALRDRLTKYKKSTRLIRFILFYQILTLV